MIIGVPKEILKNEKRVAVIPSTVKEYIKKGIEVIIETNAGAGSFISDNEYESAGAKIIDDVKELFSNSDLILKVNSPLMNENIGIHESEMIKNGSAFISFFQTTMEKETVKKFIDKKITGISMHLVPRTTLAQKMDALSSQSNIAGYKAILIGAGHIAKYMPLLMTAAGTIQPSKVLIIGAGVAGLQAIATAKRLGAQVEAFDVRPVVKEQVESLEQNLLKCHQTKMMGLEKEVMLKKHQKNIKKQAELLKDHIAKSDLVVTTALIPGRPAPQIISKDMVNGMRGGSAIMDLASENGGNCELTKPGEIINVNDVIIDGSFNIPSSMPIHASQVYSKNISALVNYMCPEGELNLDMKDEIISGSIFVINGEITNDQTAQALKGDI